MRLFVALCIVVVAQVVARPDDESAYARSGGDDIVDLDDAPPETPKPRARQMRGQEKAGRVRGGYNAKLADSPFMVVFTGYEPNKRMRFKCGGSILDEYHVLTAAHCVQFQGTVLIDFKAYVGTDYFGKDIHARTRNNLNNNITVVGVTAHALYRSAKHEFDIALLHLDQPLTWTEITKPICLPTKDDSDFAGKMSIVVGFGAMSESIKGSEVLQEVKLPIISSAECNVPYMKFMGLPITDNMICATTNNGAQDACQGDSGGPLMLETAGKRRVQIGVVSFGGSCGGALVPGVYVRVTKFLDWIRRAGAQFQTCEL